MSIKKIFFFISILITCNCAFSNIVVTNGLTHKHKIKEGIVYKGFISVENTSKSVQNVKIYQKDYSYKANGTSEYNDSGLNNRSNINWIKLNTNLLRLEAKGKANIAYEIIVPKDIDVGSFWSVIMIEPIDEIKPSNDKPGLQIKSVIRYSIQIITTNDQPAEALLNFDSMNLNKTDGKRVLEIDISNNGQLYHTVEVSIQIFDNKSGANKGVYKSNLLSLLPNNSKRFSIDLSTVAPGKYNAAIFSTSDEDHIFGINTELDIPNE